MFNTDKSEYIKELLNLYDDKARLSYCKLAMCKYRFENYGMSDFNIADTDYVVQNKEVANLLNQCILNKSCSKSELENILQMIPYKDLIYIGI
jgi:hypothetical protein